VPLVPVPGTSRCLGDTLTRGELPIFGPLAGPGRRCSPRARPGRRT